MRFTDRLFSVFFLIVLGIFGYETSKFQKLPYETYSLKLFPYLIIGFCFIMVCAVFVNSFLKKNDQPSASEVWRNVFSKRRMAFLFAVVVYLVLMKAIGFVVSTSLFLMLTILGLSTKPKKDFLKGILVTICVVGGVVIVVTHFLQAFLP